MRNNRATWIFLILLPLPLIWYGITFHEISDTAIYPALVFFMALFVVIKFVDWTSNLPPDGFLLRKLPFLSRFAEGEKVPRKYRALIFAGGLSFSLLYFFIASAKG